jgi:hypothetical protein
MVFMYYKLILCFQGVKYNQGNNMEFYTRFLIFILYFIVLFIVDCQLMYDNRFEVNLIIIFWRKQHETKYTH